MVKLKVRSCYGYLVDNVYVIGFVRAEGRTLCILREDSGVLVEAEICEVVLEEL